MPSFHQGICALTLGLTLAHSAWAADATTTTAPATPAATGSAAAEPLVPVSKAETPRLENSDRLFHLVATGGISFGGDTIATAYYNNGDSEDLTAGGLVYIAAGIGLDIPETPLTVQVAAGYQVNDSTADNGSMTFDRNTLDAQLFLRHGNHRFGVGLVQHNSPEYVGKIDGQPDDRASFDDASGFSLEYNYLPMSFNWPFKNSRAGFSLRYVKIDYEARTVNGMIVLNPRTIDGSHVAAGLYLYL